MHLELGVSFDHFFAVYFSKHVYSVVWNQSALILAVYLNITLFAATQDLSYWFMIMECSLQADNPKSYFRLMGLNQILLI